MKLFIKWMIMACFFYVAIPVHALSIKGKRLNAKGGSFFVEAFSGNGRVFYNTIKLDQNGNFNIEVAALSNQLYWFDGIPIYLFENDEVSITLPAKKSGISNNLGNSDGFELLGKRSKENKIFFDLANRWDNLMHQPSAQSESSLAQVEKEYQLQKLSIKKITDDAELREIALGFLHTKYLEASLSQMRKNNDIKQNSEQLISNLKAYSLNDKAVNALRQISFIAAVDAIYVLNQIKNGVELAKIPTKNFASTAKIKFVIKNATTNRLLNEEVLQSIVNHLSLQGMDEDMADVMVQAKQKVTEKPVLDSLNALVAKYQGVIKNAVAPSFTLSDKSGKALSLSDLKGKIVVIDVWATWCLPCRETLPAFLAWREKYKTQSEICFLTISIDDENAKDKWLQFLKDYKMDGIELFADKNFIKDYAVSSIPRYVFVDKEGKIIDGYAPHSISPDFEVLIQKAIGNKD